MEKISHIARREIQRMGMTRETGVSCRQTDKDSNILEGRIIGPTDTPYERGLFKLEIEIDEHYPLNPPKVRFTTKIYHPNIDFHGRLCLDILKKPPDGTWVQHMTIMKVLVAIRNLLACPDLDNPVVPEFAYEYRKDRVRFDALVKRYTTRHARGNNDR